MHSLLFPLLIPDIIQDQAGRSGYTCFGYIDHHIVIMGIVSADSGKLLIVFISDLITFLQFSKRLAFIIFLSLFSR